MLFIHALSSKKKDEVVRAPKEILHKLQIFVELLHSGVCGGEFVEQFKHPLNKTQVPLKIFESPSILTPV